MVFWLFHCSLTLVELQLLLFRLFFGLLHGTSNSWARIQESILVMQCCLYYAILRTHLGSLMLSGIPSLGVILNTNGIMRHFGTFLEQGLGLFFTGIFVTPISTWKTQGPCLSLFILVHSHWPVRLHICEKSKTSSCCIVSRNKAYPPW